MMRRCKPFFGDIVIQLQSNNFRVSWEFMYCNNNGPNHLVLLVVKSRCPGDLLRYLHEVNLISLIPGFDVKENQMSWPNIW